MKYKGQKVEGRNVEIIPIPRPGEDIIFIAEAVENFEEFDKLCPEPVPPKKLLKGGQKVVNINDPVYKEQLDKYATNRINYIVLKSLLATKDLEWETVNYEKPETWDNFKKELKDSGFTDIEQGRIIRGVMKANALDDAMIEQARQDFLAGQGEEQK